jgi:hypothetical protein
VTYTGRVQHIYREDGTSLCGLTNSYKVKTYTPTCSRCEKRYKGGFHQESQNCYLDDGNPAVCMYEVEELEWKPICQRHKDNATRWASWARFKDLRDDGSAVQEPEQAAGRQAV